MPLNIIYTLNNWSEKHVIALKNLENKTKTLVCHRFQSELSDSGTPHLQGVLRFTRSTAYKTIHGFLGFTEIAFLTCKSIQAQWDYCGPDKQEDKQHTITGEHYYTYGECPIDEQGARKDIEMFRDAIYSGLSDYDLNIEYPIECMKYEKYIKFCRKSLAEKRAKERYMEMPEVHVIYGDAGSGKTREVFKKEGSELYMLPEQQNGTLWLDDNFSNQEAVIIDDFDENAIPHKTLLRLCDRYTPSVQTKGGFVKFHPKRIYITSNKHPDLWYQGLNSEERAALKRRITFVKQKLISN